MASLECAASSSAHEEQDMPSCRAENPSVWEPSPGKQRPEKPIPGESSPDNPSCNHPSPGDLRLVLVGKTGSGRSSSGNSILGGEVFRVDSSPCSVTSHCDRRTVSISGRSVSVIDTPGFFDTRLSPQEVAAEVGRCVVLSTPGPHALLVTLRPGRFTQEEKEALEWIRATFGPGASRYTLVLFTWGDQLGGKSMEDYLRESEELTEFVNSCQGGYHVFENSKRTEVEGVHSAQVDQLIEKIDKMVEENGGGCYTCQMYQNAERAIREVQQRILGERCEAFEVEAVTRGDKSPETTELQGKDLERRRRREEEEGRKEEEAARKKAEKLFWCELVTALGKGAAEGAGVMEKEKGKRKGLKKVKVVERAAALAATPLSITSAVKVVGGAVREGSKVLYKHRKTFLN